MYYEDNYVTEAEALEDYGSEYDIMTIAQNYENRLKDLCKEKELRKSGKHIDGFWVMQDYSRIKFKDMTNRHLNNAIRHFERKLEGLCYAN